MVKKNINSFLSAIFLVFLLCLPFLVFADESDSSGILGRLEKVGESGGYSSADETSLASGLGLVANVVLSILGVLFIILIIFGGVQWMTAGGNEEKVKKAQERIKSAIIGLIITLSAYAIWSLIDRYFINRIQQ